MTPHASLACTMHYLPLEMTSIADDGIHIVFEGARADSDRLRPPVRSYIAQERGRVVLSTQGPCVSSCVILHMIVLLYWEREREAIHDWRGGGYCRRAERGEAQGL